MNPKTSELLFRLEQADWFINCGKALETRSEVVPVSGWKEALETWATQASDDARIESQAELTVGLFKRQISGSWNPKVAEAKPLIEKLIQEKLASHSVRVRVPSGAEKVVLDALRWDLVGLCMAREYEDIIPTRYHALLEHWYLVQCA